MDPSSSHASESDDDTKALESLLDVFGSLCSLEEIASAYCKAGRDVCKAGDLLYQFQQIKPNPKPNCEVGSAHPEGSSSEDNRKNLKGRKPLKSSASMGTVSTVLGKTYTWHTPSRNESSELSKPLKLPVTKSLMDELEGEAVESCLVTRKEPLHSKNVEEFLFSMLGDGFKLSMDVIREVLCHCGYDVKKSMEELLSLSAKNLENDEAKDPDVVEKAPGKCPDMESSTLVKERSNLSREVLEALFSVPERTDEEPQRKRLEWGMNRRRAVSQRVVTKSLEDDDLAVTNIKMTPHILNVDEDEYKVLRRAVKMHWDAMKTYYEAAIEAFAKGDHVQANYLLDQGKHYNKMAREADEKSAGEIIETRETNIQADVTVDLHKHSPKEAIHLLKLHLSSLASIPSFKYLKVIVDSDDAVDDTKGRRKRLVIKLLERESITWTEEEGSPGTIFIQLDLIDPEKLSFPKGSN